MRKNKTSNSKDKLLHKVRPELIKLAGYIPIEPVDMLGLRAGIKPEEIIKLDGNENPYGCSPAVSRALANYPYFCIYPDPWQREVREALAKYTGISSDCIVAGNGSDELIDLTLRLFLKDDENIINCSPTFGMYPFNTELCGGEVIDIPRKEDFSVDMELIKSSIDKKTKLIFLASPNNPTGNLVPQSQIKELLGKNIIVVVDEAYYEFCGVTVSSLIKQYENLIVLRTFSKWGGLAGLRAGYGIMNQEIAKLILKIKPPYNLNAAAQVGILVTLENRKEQESGIEKLNKERERLFGLLNSLHYFKLYPSEANFILCQLTRGDAREVNAKLQERGIFVRYFDMPRLQNYLRITVGRPEQDDKLIDALEDIMKGLI